MTAESFLDAVDARAGAVRDRAIVWLNTDDWPTAALLASAADVPRLSAFARAVLALCEEETQRVADVNERLGSRGTNYDGRPIRVTSILSVAAIRAARAEHLGET